MTALSNLIEQRDALTEQIKALALEERAGTIAKIRTLMSEGGLTLADLGPARATTASAAGSTGTRNKVEPKFRDDAGHSWSGRGLKPKWLTAAMAAGATIDDFKI